MSPARVVAHAPPEDFLPADELVGKDFLILEDLSFQGGVKRLRQ